MLSFDAVDMAGKHDTDIVKGGDIEIHKYRLDRFGMHMDHDEYVPPAVVQIVETPFGVQLNGQAKEVRRPPSSAAACQWCCCPSVQSFPGHDTAMMLPSQAEIGVCVWRYPLAYRTRTR